MSQFVSFWIGSTSTITVDELFNGCTFKRAISVMWLGFISLTCDLPKQPLLSERIYQDTFGSVSEHPLSDSSPYTFCDCVVKKVKHTHSERGLVGIKEGTSGN